MTRCEVVEVRNLADAVGFACSNPAVGHCSDCDMEICDSHGIVWHLPRLFSALPVCRCIDIGSLQQRITDKPANAEVPEAFPEQSLQVFPESVTGKSSWLRLRTKGCD
jgi:hypothetical protein